MSECKTNVCHMSLNELSALKKKKKTFISAGGARGVGGGDMVNSTKCTSADR